MTKEEAIKIINCYDIGFYDLSGEKIRADKLAEAFDMAIEALRADRPQGEWIDRGMRVPSSWVKKCSLCGHETDTWRWCNFCPNCGADMKGSGE